jgi:NitT/TauT family transport system substrate-binding protein/sulfonate transport system substrate-binding protein
MKKSLALLLALGLLVCMFAGCSQSESNVTSATQSETSDGMTTIRCGWLTTAIPVPNFYAQEQGWYDELGIELEVTQFASGPAANEAVGAGSLDIATMGGMPAVLGGIAYDYKVVGWLEDDDFALQVYARNDSDIVAAGTGNVEGYPNLYGTPETWKGKSIIVTSATSAHFAVGSVLKAMGLEESDVNIIDMDGASGAAAFLAGEGDLYCAWDPQYNAFSSDPDNYTRVATCADAGASFICVTVASAEYCENNPDEIVKYLEGMVRAADVFANDDQTYYDAMYRWQSEYSEVTEEVAETSAAIRKMYDLDGMTQWHETDENGNSKLSDAMYTIADFMVENGLIEASDKEALIENGFVDTSYMLQAIENVKNS